MQQDAEEKRRIDTETNAIVEEIKASLSNLTGTPLDQEDQDVSRLAQELLDTSFEKYIQDKVNPEMVVSKLGTQTLLSSAQGEETDRITEEKNRIQLEIMKGLMDKNKKLIEKLLQKTNKAKVENSEIIEDLKKLIELSEKQKEEIQELRKLEPKLKQIMEFNRQLQTAQSSIPKKLESMQIELAKISGQNEGLEEDKEYAHTQLDNLKREVTDILSGLTGSGNIDQIGIEDVDKGILEEIQDRNADPSSSVESSVKSSVESSVKSSDSSSVDDAERTEVTQADANQQTTAGEVKETETEPEADGSGKEDTSDM